MADTATITIQRGTITLPKPWARDLDGREALLTRVGKVVLLTLDDQYEEYSNEDIRRWVREDRLNAKTKKRVRNLLSS